MFRVSIIVLTALWVCVAVITCINIYRHFEAGKLQMRVLNDYKLMSEVNDIFKSVQDSLYRDAVANEKRITEIARPFPLKSKYWNWLMLRLSVVFLALLSILAYWYYYKKMQPV